MSSPSARILTEYLMSLVHKMSLVHSCISFTNLHLFNLNVVKNFTSTTSSERYGDCVRLQAESKRCKRFFTGQILRFPLVKRNVARFVCVCSSFRSRRDDCEAHFIGPCVNLRNEAEHQSKLKNILVFFLQNIL